MPKKKLFKNSACSHSFCCYYLGILNKTISSWSQVPIGFFNREINQKCLKNVIFRKSFANKKWVRYVAGQGMPCLWNKIATNEFPPPRSQMAQQSRLAASIITAACWQQLLFFNAVYVFIPGMAYIFTTTTTIHFKWEQGVSSVIFFFKSEHS